MDRYEGFEAFVSARGQALIGTAYLLTGDRHLAEDLLQIVLTKLARRWPAVRLDGNPEGYARKALYREFVSWRRVARNREQPRGTLPETTTAADIADVTVRKLALRQALAGLTPRQRAVLVVRFFEDRTASETAALLGCTVGAVKSQTHHALKRLRALAPDLADLLNGDCESTTTGGRP
jgi:RNA polymerase sigma-70 factor (sigma-E family)